MVQTQSDIKIDVVGSLAFSLVSPASPFLSFFMKPFPAHIGMKYEYTFFLAPFPTYKEVVHTVQFYILVRNVA